MRLGLFAVCVSLVFAGCLLRPRYGDFVTSKTTESKLDFVVIDTDTNKPVPGAKVEMSELKNKLVVTTNADGAFSVPVEKKYLDENPVLVVTLPKGSIHYRLEKVALPAMAPEAPPEAMPAPIAPPLAEDAGVPATDPLRTNG